MGREQRERGGGNPKNIKNMRAEAAGAGTGGAPKHPNLSGLAVDSNNHCGAKPFEQCNLLGASLHVFVLMRCIFGFSFYSFGLFFVIVRVFAIWAMFFLN